MAFEKNQYVCDYCQEVLGPDWELLPFQVGQSHYCNEEHAREHYHNRGGEDVGVESAG